jgi:hypothetical protein
MGDIVKPKAERVGATGLAGGLRGERGDWGRFSNVPPGGRQP